MTDEYVLILNQKHSLTVYLKHRLKHYFKHTQTLTNIANSHKKTTF